MPIKPERPATVQLQERYLPSTASFIYQYITNMRRYRPVVVAPFGENPERFRVPDLFIPKLSTLQALLVKADRRLFKRQRLVEPYFRQVIQSSKAVLLHAHFGPVGVFAMPIQSKVPLVTTFYGKDMSALPRKPGWHGRYRQLFAKGALFLVEGSHMRKELLALGCPPEKIQIQRIGVDLQSFAFRSAPPADENVRILMCGRFVEKKGFEYGIRAFAQALPRFPKAQLRIVGDGPLRSRIEQLIRQFGLEKHVILLGFLNYAAYAEEAANAHVFLAPSVTASDGDSEGGAPTTLLEMQARGVPVLSTWHADIPEVVLDGVSGHLVPERDETALGDMLTGLLAHPERWNDMGRAGRDHVEKHHDIVKLAQQLEEKYDSVLALFGQKQTF